MVGMALQRRKCYWGGCSPSWSRPRRLGRVGGAPERWGVGRPSLSHPDAAGREAAPGGSELGAGGVASASAASFPTAPVFAVKQETRPSPECNDGKRGVRALARETAQRDSL